jgi:hypothetical protein
VPTWIKVIQGSLRPRFAARFRRLVEWLGYPTFSKAPRQRWDPQGRCCLFKWSYFTAVVYDSYMYLVREPHGLVLCQTQSTQRPFREPHMMGPLVLDQYPSATIRDGMAAFGKAEQQRLADEVRRCYEPRAVEDVYVDWSAFSPPSPRMRSLGQQRTTEIMRDYPEITGFILNPIL